LKLGGTIERRREREREKERESRNGGEEERGEDLEQEVEI